jgi:hypothetical protein
LTTERDEVEMAESVDAFEALGQHPHPRKNRDDGAPVNDVPSSEVSAMVSCVQCSAVSRDPKCESLGRPQEKGGGYDEGNVVLVGTDLLFVIDHR